MMTMTFLLHKTTVLFLFLNSHGFIRLINALATTTRTDQNDIAMQQSPPALSFELGGEVLQPPQDLPDFLHPYHSKSLELTANVLSDTSVKCERAVSYGEKDTHKLMDIWTPTSTSETSPALLPTVVFIHGGGWDWGYREWVGFCSRHICNNADSNYPGAVMVAPSYTIGKGTSQAWPNSKQDILEALQWIRDNIEQYGGDPSRIVLAGHSAGGHLASCVGLDTPLLQSAGVDPESIKALFVISSPLGVRTEDFFRPIAKRKWLWKVLRPLANIFHRRVVLTQALRPLVGEITKQDSSLTDNTIRDASPLVKLEEMKQLAETGKRQSIPFIHYSFAAKKDFPICRPHAAALAEFLEPDKFEILEMPVSGHFDTHFILNDPTCEWYDSFRKILSSSV